MRSVVLLALLFAGAAHADTLTLAGAQSEARARAPEGGELAARIRGAEVIARDAHRMIRTDPIASGEYTTGALTGNPDERTLRAGIEWTIDVSGSWRPRGAAADADLDRARFDGDAGLRALDEAVAIAVADLALAQRRAARVERVVELFRIAHGAAKKQLEVGQGNQLDVDAAELELAAAEGDLVGAQGERQAAQIGLSRLLGRRSFADLAVDDPDESTELPNESELAALVMHDPRVRAAEAELRGARLERRTNDRLVWPTLTLGAALEHARKDVPAGAFVGMPAASARWTDTEVMFSAALPLPLFDRRREARARSLARIYAAEANVVRVSADVLAQLQDAWSALRAAAATYQALAKTPQIVDREIGLLNKALATGALDTVARSQALRRLVDAGRRHDEALHDLRVARARWIRRTAGLR